MRILLDQGPGVTVQGIAPLAAGDHDQVGERAQQLGHLVEARPHEEGNPPLREDGELVAPRDVVAEITVVVGKQPQRADVVSLHAAEQFVEGGCSPVWLGSSDHVGNSRGWPAVSATTRSLPTADGRTASWCDRRGPGSMLAKSISSISSSAVREKRNTRVRYGPNAALQSKNFMRSARRWGIRFPARGAARGPS